MAGCGFVGRGLLLEPFQHGGRTADFRGALGEALGVEGGDGDAGEALGLSLQVFDAGR